MSIWIGDRLTVEIKGTSHGPNVSVKCKGFPKYQMDFFAFQKFLDRRKAGNYPWSTKRIEKDEPKFKGLKNGYIKGSFKAIVKNENVKKKDYDALYGKPRPSHADLIRYFKDGTLDFSGGGEYSGRLTLPFCIAGFIAKDYLEKKYGVKINAYLSSVGKVQGKSYKAEDITKFLPVKDFPSIDRKDEMIEEIEKATKNLDSVGGVVDCVVKNAPKGLGGNLFSGLDGKISTLCYAIPGVKGVEFGDGFSISKKRGSKANDELYFFGDKIRSYSNFSGGINGGASNGFPITLSVAFRPTPSIAKKQRTVDLVNNKNVEIEINGRHDGCIAVRAVPVVESAVAIAILDSLEKYE